MMPTFARTRRQPRHALVTASLLLAVSLVLVMLAQSRGVPGAGDVRSAAVALTLPVVDAGAGVSDWSSGTWAGLFAAESLREENERLRRELAEERIARAAVEMRAEELGSSAALVESLPEFAGEARAARVIAPVIDGRRRRLWIDMGSGDGVRVGQAVLGPGGLIGAIVEVHGSHSVVRLVTDDTSRWGAEVNERAEAGILRGTGDSRRAEFRLEKTTTEIRPGDWVRTSGTRGSLVPVGIPIGEVTTVAQDHTGERRAVIALPDSPESLRYVFVLNAFQLPWEAPR